MQNITSLGQLEELALFTPKEKHQLEKVLERHPMSVSRYYLALIDWNDPEDPIRKMAIPSVDELDISGSYDTSGEEQSTKMPGLQHKYRQTVLILATNRCAMYCRQCFRKRFVGLSNEEVVKRLDKTVKYIKVHEEVNNVLVTGGDPFVLPTQTLKRFIENLSGIEHLDFIRFGTRTPVTFPQRILWDEKLVEVLRNSSDSGKRIYVVTQFNHPRELTATAMKAVDTLTDNGVAVSNQAVLMRGVNDSPEVLAQLLRCLVRNRIVPYYVFQCRPVKRVKKGFQVPLWEAQQIVEDARKMLDGHSKRFRFIMSHRSGKIEILGVSGDAIFLKYHQARNPKNLGKIMIKHLDKAAGWFDDLEKDFVESLDYHESGGLAKVKSLANWYE